MADKSLNVDQALKRAKSLAKKGELEQATELYSAVLEKFPANKRAKEGLKSLERQGPPREQIAGVNALYKRGQLQEALEQGTALAERYPNVPQIFNVLGRVNDGLGRLDQAVASYTKALQIRPDYAWVHNNLGNTLHALGQFDEAINSYTKALQINPDFAEAHSNLGSTFNVMGKPEEAIASYTKALQIKPDYAQAKGQKIHQQALICDWVSLESEGSDIASSIAALGTTQAIFPPFSVLSLEDHPERHRKRSELYAANKYARPSLGEFKRPQVKPSHIRIGYVSADYRDHPVMHLIARSFELHDRSRFRLHAYSYGPPYSGPLRSRLEASFDVFHDVGTLSDSDVAQLARDEGVDIAVDLTGYTTNSRTGIFSYRAAPVQVNYLGYPGTLGAPFIEYIVADKTIIPEASQKYYSEKVIRLPHCYQPQDNTKPILLIRDTPSEEVYVLNMFRMRGSRL